MPVRVRERERDAVRPQRSADLGQREIAVGDVIQHVHREHAVERPVDERQPLRVADEERRRRNMRPRRLQHPRREIHAVHLAAVRAPRQLGEVQTVPAADVENPLVTAQPGEIERPRRRSDGGLLESIDRLAGREVRVGGVLNSVRYCRSTRRSVTARRRPCRRCRVIRAGRAPPAPRRARPARRSADRSFPPRTVARARRASRARVAGS